MSGVKLDTKERLRSGLISLIKRWFGGEEHQRWVDYIFILAFVILVLIGGWASDVFFTQVNITNLLRQIVANGLISLGMLIVIVTGGIDLSVGSVVALAGIIYAGMTDQVGIVPAISIALVVGAVVGLVNGFLVAHFKLQSFIVTLASMGAVRGLVFVYSESPLIPKNLAFREIGARFLGPVSVATIIMLACYGLVWLFILAYILSGFFSALGGVILVSRLGIAQPSLGVGYELDAIAACVIGGGILGGGGGGTIGTFFGVLTLGLINNLLNLFAVQTYYQQILKGVVIVVAVLARAKER
jgi:ribose transport system permease protein